jgi:Tol biopolymer transport system component
MNSTIIYKMTAYVWLAAALLATCQIARADFFFGKPVNLGPPVNDSYGVRGSCISHDGLSLYFSSNRHGGYGGYDLWVVTRETTGDNWGDPVNLGHRVNRAYDAWDPSISSDGLSLYFSDGFSAPFMPGGYGDMDLWIATRSTTSEPFGAPVNLGPTLNNGGPNEWPCISADGLSLYSSGWHPGTLGLCDLWVSTRISTNENWQAPLNLRTVNSPSGEGAPDISGDGLALFFISTRPRGFTSIDNFEL